MMDEYIKREDAARYIEEHPFKSFEQMLLLEEIGKIPPADVVEREKYDDLMEAYDMAQHYALERKEMISEDAISREWVLNELNKREVEYRADINEVIISAPSVIPSRPKGEWIDNGSSIDHVWKCSECGELEFGSKKSLTNFCPNCGADMRGAE